MHRWSLTFLLTGSAMGATWLALGSPGAPLDPRRVPTTPLDGGITPPAEVLTTPISAPAGAIGATDGCVTVRFDLDTPALPTPGLLADTLDSATRSAPLHQGVSLERYGLVSVTADGRCDTLALPVQLAVVVDVSGSMDSPEKLPEARRAIAELGRIVPAGTEVSLTTFSNDAVTVAPMGPPGATLFAAAKALRPDAGTNLEAGLLQGQRTLSGPAGVVRRLLLLTDGEANAGATTLQAGLQRDLDGRPDVTVSTIGLGLAYNEELLTALADAGHGTYHYAPSGTALAQVYREELGAASHLVAREAELSVTLPGGLRPVSAWGGNARMSGQEIHLSLGDLSQGDTRRLLVKLAVDDTSHVDPTAIGGAELRFAQVDGRGGRTLWTAAQGLLSADPAVLAKRDPTIAARAVRLEGAALIEQARKSYAAGDKSGADTMIGQQAARLRALGYIDSSFTRDAEALDDIVAAPSPAESQKMSSEAWYGSGRK